MRILDLIHVNTGDIQNLNEYESTDLLEKLLRYEFRRNSLEVSGLTLSSNPNIPDQGIDAAITKPIPPDLDYLPSGISIFQFKASESYFNVKKEFFVKDSDNLKPLIKKFLDKNASYILINTKKVWNEANKEDLKQKIRDKLEERDINTEFPIILYSADDIARWCDKYPPFRLQFNKFANGKEFKTWKKETLNGSTTELIRTDSINTLIWEIIEEIGYSDKNVRIIRVLGQKGIGKKTLLTQALDNLPPIEKANIIVIDAHIVNLEDISRTLFYFNISSGILILLNCSDKDHKSISKKVTSINMKDFTLITLNSQPFINKSKFGEETKLIEISGWNNEDVEKLIKKIDPSLQANEKEVIIKYSQGVPGFVIKIYEMIKRKDFELTESEGIQGFCESILNFLVEESHFDRAIMTRLLVGFSLFSYLGWKVADYKELNSDYGFEYKFRNHKRIFSDILDLEDQLVQVEEITNYLLDLNILQMRGRYIYISFPPLAMYLLDNYQEEKIIDFFEKIRNLNNNHFLNRFLERLEDLASKEVGERIVKIILKGSSFDNWRKFNEREISRILLHISKINNKDVAKKLISLFKDAEYDDLREELTNRRNLIYALGHIIRFWETFRDGMDVLLKLAIAENERLANNTTNLFQEKFSIRLPGTSASLKERITYLKELNESEDEKVKQKVLNALSFVFYRGSHYSRSIGDEIQGLKPLPKEYEPKTYGEINEYMREGFEILKESLDSSNQNIQDLSYEILNENFMNLINLDLWDQIQDYWNQFINISQENKFKLLKIINRKIQYENHKINDFKNVIKKGLNNSQEKTEIRSKLALEIIDETLDKGESLENSELDNLIDDLVEKKLEPTFKILSELERYKQDILDSFSILDEINWLLINILNWYPKSGQSYDEYLKNQAENIIQKINENISNLEEILSLLIINGGELIVLAGKKFAKQDPKCEKWNLIKQIFLSKKEEGNPDFIIGYLSEFDSNIYNEKIDEIKQEEGLSSELFDFAINKELDEWSINLMIELYENEIIDDLDLLRFSNPRRVESLNHSLYQKLITFYFKNVKDPLNVKRGSMGDHLYILKYYLQENEEIIPKLKEVLLEIILSFKDFESHEYIQMNSGSPMKTYRHMNLSPIWKELVLLIIDENPSTLRIIRKTILEHLDKLPILVSQPDVQEVFLKFLKLDEEGTLNDFFEKFMDGSGVGYQYQFYFDNEFVRKIPEEQIISFCKKDPKKYPPLIVRMVDEKIRTIDSPPRLLLKLIEEFHDNDKLRIELIRSFEKGVRAYLPGRSQGVVLSYIGVLKKWKHNTTSEKFLDWIDEAIEYFKKQSKRARMRDEETIIPLKKRDKDFYNREKWLNSIKDEYLGEIIAFSNIEGNWKVITHAIDDDEIFNKLNDLYEENLLDKKYKIKFRKF